MVDTNDRRLVASAQVGDEGAFAELIERHGEVAWAVCVRMCRNTADAEDAFQDTLTAAWRNLDHFRSEAKFGTWLYRIASNASLMQLRKRTPDPVEDAQLVSYSPSHESAQVDRVVVAEALQALPHPFREAVVLYHFGDLSYQEIADAQGVAIDTVKSRLHRARKMLAAILD